MMPALVPGEHDAVLNGIRIHYTVSGEGPALIAIYGGPGLDARGFEGLAGIGEFVTLIVMHPRGSGLSGPAPGKNDYLLSHYAADVEALRRHLRLERPIVLGWSHGGMVAQQFAITYPDSLSGLILLDTSAYFGDFAGGIDAAIEASRDRPWFRDAYSALQRQLDGAVETDEDMAVLWSEEMKFFFRDFDARAEAYHRRTRRLPLRMAPLRCFNVRERSTMDLRPRLPGIKVPTLVIVGRHDFITPLPMAEEIVRCVPGARLEVFEGSGHFAFVEEPEKFCRVIRDFVTS